jgi:hypothetical protein
MNLRLISFWLDLFQCGGGQSFHAAMWAWRVLLHAKLVKPYMDVDLLLCLFEDAQRALNRATVDNPRFSVAELLEKMGLQRSDTGQARHLGDAAAV